MRIDTLIAEADKVINKKASLRVAPINTSDSDPDTVKLANFLGSYQEPKAVVSSTPAPFEMNFVEKLACSVAMVEALNNAEEFQKLAKFQESAKTQGYSDVQINEFLEKRAMELPVSISIETLNSIARNAKG